MLRKKLAESLTARIFLITAAILLAAGAITFSLVAWATPSTYTAVANDELTAQVEALAAVLAETPYDQCGPLLDDFLRTTGAAAMLVDSDGRIADSGAQLAVQPIYEDDTVVITESQAAAPLDGSTQWTYSDTVTVTASDSASIAAEVRFADRTEPYTLYVTPRLEAQNLAVRSLVQMAPWILLVLLAFSLLCALLYSRYVTRPIVRLSTIAGKLAELDFHWNCGETRRDEIGRLGRSLDEMAQRLDQALSELEAANDALRGEVEQERELDRQRMAFFSAVSHELKTPVTILRGQLSGMLEGVGVYRDRDKYLLRSLQVTGRMERLIQEMLAVARVECGAVPCRQEPLDLSLLVQRQLAQDAELLEQRQIRLTTVLPEGIAVTGDAALLGRAVENLLSNAALHAPVGAAVRVVCGTESGHPTLTIENTGAQILPESLPHLFEPFYRADHSRSRATGGSGLGLYLVKTILDRHGASCTVSNTGDGVAAVVRFPGCR